MSSFSCIAVLCDGFKTEELPKAVKIEKADRLGRCAWDAFYPRVTYEAYVAESYKRKFQGRVGANSSHTECLKMYQPL
ncbi:hypothetical protein CTI12_AA205700 [Artemisia annua]|uniref:Uncharacterized protein n=1 Tax=Artemisia annua TaxID=35608 RepID=A0A2U1P0T9_ARTAN|nr:hypothetical protein CTI12_AA205700 [Artemisia annua]